MATTIERRVQAAIRPVLDRADRAIKELLTPHTPGKHAKD